MKLRIGINPNCSECAFVIYQDKLNLEQRKFFKRFIEDRKLMFKITPKGNLSIETGGDGNPDYKDGLWALRDAVEAISEYTDLGVEESKHFDLIRDDSYYDLFDEGGI